MSLAPCGPRKKERKTRARFGPRIWIKDKVESCPLPAPPKSVSPTLRLCSLMRYPTGLRIRVCSQHLTAGMRFTRYGDFLDGPWTSPTRFRVNSVRGNGEKMIAVRFATIKRCNLRATFENAAIKMARCPLLEGWLVACCFFPRAATIIAVMYVITGAIASPDVM